MCINRDRNTIDNSYSFILTKKGYPEFGYPFFIVGFIMFKQIKSNLLWSESLWIVLILCLASIIGLLLWMPLLWISIGVFLFCFYFFRNPERICTDAFSDQQVIICPADGKIVEIADNVKGYAKKISIFLSPFDVHVNWTPIAGDIQKVQHVPGKFMMAFLPKSSELNEHNDVIIRSVDGNQILVRQIAGTVARRIVCWLKQDQKVHAGQKYGMIKFSSRIDLFLPENVTISVRVGQRVIGGKSVIGRFS